MILRLFHCTNTKALSKIIHQGLRPMKRGHVCLSEDREYAIRNGFAYFESQATYLYRTLYFVDDITWQECFEKAVGSKKKVVIEIELPFEKLSKDSQEAYKRFLNRKQRAAKLYPDLKTVKVQEVHAITIPPEYFKSIEILKGS